MLKITFSEASKALSHLKAPQQGPKPPLLGVKGWDKSKVIYHLKDDLERAFKAEFDRLRDLQQDAQKIISEAKADDRKSLSKKEQEKLEPIQDEINELNDIEKEVELTGGKLTEEDFGDVIDSGIFIDLEFAIELDSEENT